MCFGGSRCLAPVKNCGRVGSRETEVKPQEGAGIRAKITLRMSAVIAQLGSGGG